MKKSYEFKKTFKDVHFMMRFSHKRVYMETTCPDPNSKGEIQYKSFNSKPSQLIYYFVKSEDSPVRLILNWHDAYGNFQYQKAYKGEEVILEYFESRRRIHG
jgi:hypothetical protein